MCSESIPKQQLACTLHFNEKSHQPGQDTTLGGEGMSLQGEKSFGMCLEATALQCWDWLSSEGNANGMWFFAFEGRWEDCIRMGLDKT